MHSQQLLSSPESCIAAIEACAQIKDLEAAKGIYQQYRDLAINQSTNDVLDNRAYTALIKAYYTSGEEEDGLRFFERIIQSYNGTLNRDELARNLTDTFVVDGLVDHYLTTGNLHQALESLKANELSRVPAHVQ
ncbi:hypothetical protein MRB53_040684 [Persea americana]|nr:hypothetical protein MRB53_040684 [Persea americana]